MMEKKIDKTKSLDEERVKLNVFQREKDGPIWIIDKRENNKDKMSSDCNKQSQVAMNNYLVGRNDKLFRMP